MPDITIKQLPSYLRSFLTTFDRVDEAGRKKCNQAMRHLRDIGSDQTFVKKTGDSHFDQFALECAKHALFMSQFVDWAEELNAYRQLIGTMIKRLEQ